MSQVWVKKLEPKLKQPEEEVDRVGSPERECEPEPEEACSYSQESYHRSSSALSKNVEELTTPLLSVEWELKTAYGDVARSTSLLSVHKDWEQ